LRHISPITTDALNFVAKHIQCTSGLGKANVSVETVPLQFVFGSEQSNEKFTEVYTQNIELFVVLSFTYMVEESLSALSVHE
jgi:hypothetical protein